MDTTLEEIKERKNSVLYESTLLKNKLGRITEDLITIIGKFHKAYCDEPVSGLFREYDNISTEVRDLKTNIERTISELNDHESNVIGKYDEIVRLLNCDQIPHPDTLERLGVPYSFWFEQHRS